MRQHPYLRAYMAGVVVPTLAMLGALTFFCVARLVYKRPEPIERLLVFPMALLPSGWGLWNMLYLRLRARHQLPIGVFGAAFLFVVAPVAYTVQRVMGLILWRPHLVAIAFPMVLVAYYLIWKHVVGFFNELLGIG